MFIPEGYITLVDAVAAIDQLLTQFDPYYDGVDDCVERVGAMLSSGKLISRGIDLKTGIDLPIPVEVWRQSYSAIFLKHRFPQNVKYAPELPATSIIPIVKKSDVLEIFDANNELEGLFKPFNKAEWTLDVAKRDTWVDGGIHFERHKAFETLKSINKLGAKKPSNPSNSALKEWISNTYVPSKSSDVISPNAEMAWKEAIAAFPNHSVPRRQFFPIYKEIAPAEWQSTKKPKRSKFNSNN
jgi:hypothetical protein